MSQDVLNRITVSEPTAPKRIVVPSKHATPPTPKNYSFGHIVCDSKVRLIEPPNERTLKLAEQWQKIHAWMRRQQTA